MTDPEDFLAEIRAHALEDVLDGIRAATASHHDELAGRFAAARSAGATWRQLAEAAQMKETKVKSLWIDLAEMLILEAAEDPIARKALLGIVSDTYPF